MSTTQQIVGIATMFAAAGSGGIMACWAADRGNKTNMWANIGLMLSSAAIGTVSAADLQSKIESSNTEIVKTCADFPGQCSAPVEVKDIKTPAP